MGSFDPILHVVAPVAVKPFDKIQYSPLDFTTASYR